MNIMQRQVEKEGCVGVVILEDISQIIAVDVCIICTISGIRRIVLPEVNSTLLSFHKVIFAATQESG